MNACVGCTHAGYFPPVALKTDFLPPAPAVICMWDFISTQRWPDELLNLTSDKITIVLSDVPPPAYCWDVRLHQQVTPPQNNVCDSKTVMMSTQIIQPLIFTTSCLSVTAVKGDCGWRWLSVVKVLITCGATAPEATTLRRSTGANKQHLSSNPSSFSVTFSRK